MHTVSVIDRKDMRLTGIKDVISFDEQTVVLDTVFGELTVKGEQLKVTGFTSETGTIGITGTLFAFAYTSSVKKRGMIGRLIG